MPVPWQRLGLAVVVGLTTSAAFYVVAGRSPSKAGAAEAPQVPVLVVKEPVPAGRKLEPDDVGKAFRPSGQVPEGTVADLDSAVGRVVKTDLIPGEVLLEGRLYPPGSTEDIPQVLPVPPGKRAVTVAVDEVVGVAGFVMPGTYVDVVGTMDVDNQAVTRVLLQRIQVLAIAQDAKRKDDSEAKVVSSATLAVTPQEAQVLILAADRGKIRLAMRSPTESGNVQLSPVTPENLLQADQPAAKPQVARKPGAERENGRKAAMRVASAERERRSHHTESERPGHHPEPRVAPTPASILVIRGTQAELVYRDDR